MPMFKISETQKKLYKNFNFPEKEAYLTLQKERKAKKASMIGSAVGTGVGLALSIALARKKDPVKDIFVKNDVKKTIKNMLAFTKLDYEGFRGYIYMILQATGASFGSLIAGSWRDKNKENRLEKTKEAVFVINNVAIPTAAAKIIEHLLSKENITNKSNLLKKIANNKLLKNIAVLLGLAAGLVGSLNVSNYINTKIIEPDDTRKKTIKPTDLLVHVDDIVPILASSKNSIFNGLALDRLMPVIYFLLGSEVGEKNHYSKE